MLCTQCLVEALPMRSSSTPAKPLVMQFQLLHGVHRHEHSPWTTFIRPERFLSRCEIHDLQSRNSLQPLEHVALFRCVGEFVLSLSVLFIDLTNSAARRCPHLSSLAISTCFADFFLKKPTCTFPSISSESNLINSSGREQHRNISGVYDILPVLSLLNSRLTPLPRRTQVAMASAEANQVVEAYEPSPDYHGMRAHESKKASVVASEMADAPSRHSPPRYEHHKPPLPTI